MFKKYFHALAAQLFSLLNNIPSMNLLQFVHSISEGHLSVLTSFGNYEKNIYVCVCVCV